MVYQRSMLSPTTYTDSDHRTWAALYARQNDLIANHACQLFLDCLPRLGLEAERVPDAESITLLLERMSGWRLGDAQNEYLNATEWFEHIAEFRFPVTNYIRSYKSLDFTPLPDLFHEYYGHLPFFTDLYFADTVQMFGPLYLVANERQRLEIARLWWFTLEFGLLEEDGKLKAFGAGLLSSPGELRHAFDGSACIERFDLRRVVGMQKTSKGYHPTYVVLEDIGHVRRIIQDYARMEDLPVPQPAL